MNLNTLLASSTKEKINILKILYAQPSWITTEKLIEITQLERKTVSKYLNELAISAEKFGLEAELIVSKGKGALLKCKNKVAFRKLIQSVASDSLILDLAKTFLLENKVNLTKFSQQHFLSESTVRRKTSELQEFFSNYDIKLQFSKGECMIVGNEVQVRYLLSIVFWIVYRGREWPFSFVDRQKTHQFIDEFCEKLPGTVDFLVKEKLSYFFSISLIRYHFKHTIQQSKELDTYIECCDLIIQTLDLQNTFFLPIEERRFFALILQTNSLLYTNEALMEQLFTIHRKKNTQVFQAISFIENIANSRKKDLAFQLDQSIYAEWLAIHCHAQILPQFEFDSSGYNYNALVQKRYPSMWKVINDFCTSAYQETKNTIFKNKKYLASRYCILFADMVSPTYFEPKINIYFDSDLPRIPKKIFAERCKSVFESYFNIEIFLDVPESKIDLILSTTISPALENASLSTNYMFISTELNFQEIQLLYQMVNKIIKQRKAIQSY